MIESIKILTGQEQMKMEQMFKDDVTAKKRLFYQDV
jgi:hypothetical protein